MLKSGVPSARKAKRGLECAEDDEGPASLSVAATKTFNEKAMAAGDVVVHRASVLRFLAVPKSVLCRPFRPPCPTGWKMPETEAGLGSLTSGRKSLGMTRMRSSLGLARMDKFKKVASSMPQGGPAEIKDVEDDLYKSYQLNPVVVYETNEGHSVTIEPVLGKFLREHQREGIQFLFECIAGLRPYGGQGCILADDMGLGKTLQSITLIYTVLRQGLEPEKPLAKRVIVVTPTSLVRNWDNEIDKWLKGRVRCLALAESNRQEIVKRIKQFTTTRSYDVLVLSYDTFRLNAELFKSESACDLLICDEAHRLKNDQTKTSLALDSLHCKRRVLLSGTPMQNDLEEFFAMVNFCNPEVLGTVSAFRKKYQNPILIGREPDATDEEVKKSEQRSQELSDIVNQFILRRTNSLLSKHLPPKLTQVVCINMTKMQKNMYNHMIYSRFASDDENKQTSKVSAQALASINSLKKLCNHPQLLYQRECKYGKQASKGKQAYGLDTINQFFPEGFDSHGHSRRGRGASASPGFPTASSKHSNVEWSGKFLICQRLLSAMRQETDDRMVIVSNYTQTLDIFAQMCKEHNFPFVRLDGSSSAKKRQAMVDRLNDPTDDVFVFLLSSKAGGCGLNLIGANRLILFDPDWNPATDKQAAARVWRDGQKKRTYVYRFLATGSIEEKIFQRQLSKEGLQSVVADDQSLESTISMNDLKDLFSLREDTISDTHEKYKCTRCSMEKESLDGAEKLNDVPKSPIKSSNPAEQVSTPKLQSSSRGLGGGFARGRKAKRPALSPFINKPADRPPSAPQIGFPNEGDLCEWSHHIGPDSVDDALLRKAGEGNEFISFVFGNAIDGEALAKKAQLELEAAQAEVEDSKAAGSSPVNDSKSVSSPLKSQATEAAMEQDENNHDLLNTQLAGN
mmetsp:Transcript_7727/g.12495  ORF Transcript_7727/g.12495 Transcript_7727/m.12495 type:complete len:909 (-) Transcript_7727:77-2803(-)